MQYFDAQPQAGHRPRSVALMVGDRTVDLATDRGVFSAERIDTGTEVLLRHVPAPPPEGRFVDVGCGYGPIAVSMALVAPRAEVWAVDVNERALELCRANAATAEATNVVVCAAQDVPEDLAVDIIWSNPPVRVGKRAMQDLVTGWLRRLRPSGAAYLVVHKHLGSDSFHKWLVAQGWPTKRLVSQSGYRVLEVHPKPASEGVAPRAKPDDNSEAGR